jgi:hypothetical protein
VWADAVCINQEDIRERGHQVALTGRIYTSAAKVIIWLGPDTTGSAQAAFTILRNHQSLSNIRTTDHVAPLFELSRCDYFKRIWVIQEAMLAVSGTVIWGDEQIDLPIISQGIWMVTQLADTIPGGRHAFAWLSELAIRDPKDEGFDFFRVLQWARSRSCKDDIDRIYAFLGLPYLDKVAWNQVVKLINVDYTMPFSDLCFDLACCATRYGGTCSLLNSVHHGQTLDTWSFGHWPSWVPRLHDDSASDLNIGERYDNFSKPKLVYVESVDRDRKALNIRCRRLGDVWACSQAGILSEAQKIDTSKLHQFWETEIQSDANDDGPGAEIRLKFWNVLRARTGSVFEKKLSQTSDLDGGLDIFSALTLQRDENHLSGPEREFLGAMMDDFQTCIRILGYSDDLSLHMGPRRIGTLSVRVNWGFKESLRGRKFFTLRALTFETRFWVSDQRPCK